ncbi:MAG: hypothetical protein R3A49_00235 [Acidimicrobiia bacterium]
MATDPFVAPLRGDQPRQRQNLAPGVDYPPAEMWEATRAGDLRAGQPNGPLFGRPGPNVGFAVKLAHRHADQMRLLDHEETEDATSVVAEIAMARASLFGRAPTLHDIRHACVLMGYDTAPTGNSFGWRLLAVGGAHHEWALRRRIVSAVPEALLRLDPDEVGAHAADFQADLRRALSAVGT